MNIFVGNTGVTANMVGYAANGMQIVYSFRWKGVNRLYKPLDRVQIERKRQNKVT